MGYTACIISPMIKIFVLDCFIFTESPKSQSLQGLRHQQPWQFVDILVQVTQLVVPFSKL